MSKKEAGAELQFTKSTFGLISTIYLLFYSLGNFIGGYLVSRFSPKVVVSICSFTLAGFYILITIASIMFPYEVVFYIMFAIIGILHGPIWIGSITIAGNWFPKNLRGGVMGIWITAANVGKLLGSFLSAFVIDVLELDWQTLLLFVSGILMISGVQICFVKDTPDLDSNQEKLIDSNKKTNYFKAFLFPEVILCGVAYAGIKSCNFAMNLWLPFYLEDGKKYASETVVAVINSSYEVGAIIGSFVIGIISDKLPSRYYIICPALILNIPLILLLISTMISWQLVIVVFLAGLGISSINYLTTSAIVNDLADLRNNRYRGQIAGIVNGVGGFLASITQYLFGVLADKNWENAFWMLMGTLCFASIFFAILGIIHSKRNLKKVKN